MRKREKDRIVAKAVHEERERIAKIICPLCKYGADLSGDMHPIKLEANETAGTWVKCIADRIRKNAAPQALTDKEGQLVPSPADAALSSQFAASNESKEKP